MPFKELVCKEQANLLPSFRQESEKGLYKTLIANNGPVISIWFVVMAINMFCLLFMF